WGSDLRRAARQVIAAPMTFPNPYEPPRQPEDFPIERETPKRGLVWMLFSFEGRIGRAQFWLGRIGTMFAILVPMITVIVLAPRDSPGWVALAVILFLPPLIWTSLAIHVKRWHDRGKPGTWMLIGLIPYIGGMWVLIENGFLPGNPFANQ